MERDNLNNLQERILTMFYEMRMEMLLISILVGVYLGVREVGIKVDITKMILVVLVTVCEETIVSLQKDPLNNNDGVGDFLFL